MINPQMSRHEQRQLNTWEWLGIGALVVLVAGTFGGIIASRQRPTSESAKPAAAAVGIGTSVPLAADGWTLTVNGAHTTPTVGRFSGSQHRALGVYVVVDLTMQNTGNDPHTLGGDRFTIKDDRGRSYPYYKDGTLDNQPGELGNRINPGLSAPATIVFDVPPDATGLVLESLGGFKVSLGNAADIQPQ